MPLAGALPIATLSDVPAHRAVPGRQSASVNGPTVPTMQRVDAPIIVGDCTNDITYYATNTETWNVWNQVYTITQKYVGSAATTANAYALQAELNQLVNTWTNWNVTYSTTSATTMTITTNADCWPTWNDAYAVEAADRENQIRRDIIAGKRPSAEQQEKWRLEEIARKDAEAKRLREELTAKDKAIALLKSCLTPQQIEEFERKQCFHLHVGGKVYRIEQGSHGNVKLVDKDGRVKRSFCVQPRGVPDGDTMLAQKLLLETDEKKFYELANVTEYEDGRQLRTLHAPRGADLLREVQQNAG